MSAFLATARLFTVCGECRVLYPALYAFCPVCATPQSDLTHDAWSDEFPTQEPPIEKPREALG